MSKASSSLRIPLRQPSQRVAQSRSAADSAALARAEARPRRSAMSTSQAGHAAAPHRQEAASEEFERHGSADAEALLQSSTPPPPRSPEPSPAAGSSLAVAGGAGVSQSVLEPQRDSLQAKDFPPLQASAAEAREAQAVPPHVSSRGGAERRAHSLSPPPRTPQRAQQQAAPSAHFAADTGADAARS